MKRILSILLIFLPILFCYSCDTKPAKVEENRIVLIESDFGKIKILLYNETPQHRDNFLKNVEEGIYDGTIFHRVIKNFMIQGGNPETREDASEVDFSSNKTIKAEIVPELYHKFGALAAARMADNVNPNRESSAYQFYISVGQPFEEDALRILATNKNERAKSAIANNIIMERANQLIDEGLQPDFNSIYLDLKETIDQELETFVDFKFSQEQIDTYTTKGGTPHLDSEYTVFGEVIEGMDVVKKIIEVDTKPNDRPLKDIRMKISIVN